MYDPFSLRHTFTTLPLKNGMDVTPLSGMLGHYSAGFPLGTYTHVAADMKRDAANTIGNVISQTRQLAETTGLEPVTFCM